MIVNLNEREIGVIQNALFLAKDEYLKIALDPNKIVLNAIFRQQADDAMTLYTKLELA